MSRATMGDIRMAMRRRTAKEIRAEASVIARETVGAMLVGVEPDSPMRSYRSDGTRIYLGFADGSEITIDVTCTTLPDVYA